MGVISVWPQPVSLSFHIVAVDTLGEGEGHITTMLCILQTNVEYKDFTTQDSFTLFKNIWYCRGKARSCAIRITLGLT